MRYTGRQLQAGCSAFGTSNRPAAIDPLLPFALEPQSSLLWI